MSNTLLIGKAKELHVATLLVAKHLHVYFPLVDNGFDLLVTNSDGTKFLPVQVKYKRSPTGFSLKRTDAKKFQNCNAVLAFGSGTAQSAEFYFLPAQQWASKVEDRGRGDDRLVVYLTKHREWAKQFVGDAGIDLAFANLLVNG